MNLMNPRVDAYVKKAKTWQEEMAKLRTILLGCGLAEELKWGKPCYTLRNSNVVIIIGFKEYCALMFFKGALLRDAKRILVQPGRSSQAARQLRFTDVQQIVKMEPILKAYVHEAVGVEKAGLKVAFKKNPEPTPKELQTKLDTMPALKTAFEALTPGRQRAYILYFSSAKQSKTRESRIAKCLPRILEGKGLADG